MQIRFQNSPVETKQMTTEQLRQNFLIDGLMHPGTIQLTYSHYDRMIVGGVVPTSAAISLPKEEELKANFFLERREMGIINVGGKGTLTADGVVYEIEKLECVYLGKGTKEVSFSSTSDKEPAHFYLLSVPAHQAYPNKKMTKAEASPVNLGDISTSNKRTIYKYIHNDGIQSCQLVMGLTTLDAGSVWNSVPPHTHTRRMEAYFYFDLDAAQRVMHFMGEPQETRHLVMANNEAVLSAPWSMHFGVGTANYGFIWGMAGENKEFTDMDPVPVATIK
ncbi:MAG: 5-dehydro-4-deoxy-D-glucuronate isomerase [Chitinophagaceae bacterium]|nr:5-dehydro-4-deoxy-D-glucuronate isomerase [Chitinophagaceae bacterium]MBP6476804.1 5-dehydro-4-deoxy-D-glucuronate isomerase [Chitinophagaceae bacterium]MBP7107583.1 5-dehydro-4-deoxy-D-glucuronate isomerase [Chitinophagaceae bacterium]